MGIYDREYYRDEPGGFHIRKPGTIIGWLLVINIAVFLTSALLTTEQLAVKSGVPIKIVSHPVNTWLGLDAGDLAKPWLWWRFLTYGFCHASFWHIFGNMIGLFFLGAAVEQHYGSKEFLRIYLAMIVFAGVAWAASVLLFAGNPAQGVVGASGAVVGVIVLFALNFPRQTVLLMGVLPMPAWLLGVIVVVPDLFRSVSAPDQIAFQAHLAGAAFAFLYWKSGWNFTRITDKFPSGNVFRRRPRLKVHDPDVTDRKEVAREAELDRILDKIRREGEASLTRKERRTLQSESRRLREKRGGL